MLGHQILARRNVSVGAVFLVVAVAIAVVGGLLAYTSTLQQSAQQPVQVTWQDANGNAITSISLRSNTQGPTSQTVWFKCNPGVGKVALRTSSSLGNAVILSQASFPSCGSSPDTVTLTVSPNAPPSSGTLQVLQPDIYKSLSGTLTISTVI
jgi:hypothetical protein